MNFKEYLSKIGDEKACELFNAKPRTVGSWRRGERKPSPDKAVEIVKLSKGKVKLQDIYV